MTTVQSGIFRNFLTFREGQIETIEMAVESEKKFVIISAPTGVGKTLIGMTTGHCASSSVYVVSTKMLQDQIGRDFPESVVLKGRSNYPCPRFAEYDCMADSCVKRGCEWIGDCEYEQTKSKALQARYRVLNLAYYLNEVNHRGGFSGQGTVIIDEADGVEQGLIDYISLELRPHDMRLLDTYNLSEPTHYTKPETWIPWAESCYTRLMSEVRRLEESSRSSPELLKRYKQVKRLSSKMDILRVHADSSWIRYTSGSEPYQTVIYKPVWITPELAERFLFRHGNKFVFLSATFPAYEVYCRLMSLPILDTEYISLPSPFAIASRLIHYRPIADMSYKVNDIPSLLSGIKSILALYPSERGVIHATSYRLRDAIMDIDDSRLITHTSSDKEAVVEAFRRSGDPLVLVSPSMERGISLDDDLARFQIVAKVPYQSTQDRVVSARLYSGSFGQEWYQADAAQRIVQMCGRSTRSVSDYSVCYILDSQFSKLAGKPRLFPEWFRDAIVYE